MPWRVSSAAESTVTSPSHFTVTLHLEPSHIGHIAQSVCTAIPSSHAWAPRIRWLFETLAASTRSCSCSKPAVMRRPPPPPQARCRTSRHTTPKVVLGAVAAIQPPSNRHPAAIEPPSNRRSRRTHTSSSGLSKWRRNECGGERAVWTRRRWSRPGLHHCRAGVDGTLGSRARAQALRRATRALGEVSRGAEHQRHRHAHRYWLPHHA